MLRQQRCPEIQHFLPDGGERGKQGYLIEVSMRRKRALHAFPLLSRMDFCCAHPLLYR